MQTQVKGDQVHGDVAPSAKAGMPFLAGALAIAGGLYWTLSVLLDPRGVRGYLLVFACVWASLMLLALAIRWRVRAVAQQADSRDGASGRR